MTWQAAHSWKEESAKSGVMLFNAAVICSMNKARGYKDRDPAQIQADLLMIMQRTQSGSVENEKVKKEQYLQARISKLACIKMSLPRAVI